MLSQYATCMKRFLLIPLVVLPLLQLAGIAATPPQQKKKSRAVKKKLPYKAKVPGVDPTMGETWMATISSSAAPPSPPWAPSPAAW